MQVHLEGEADLCLGLAGFGDLNPHPSCVPKAGKGVAALKMAMAPRPGFGELIVELHHESGLCAEARARVQEGTRRLHWPTFTVAVPT